jgi:hypothetical protein
VNSIDLVTILQQTVSTGYGDLVTRHTGRAVRGGVEEILDAVDGGQVAVIDFSAVGCLDISCADEIVGRLLLDYGHGRYFLLRGVSEAHCEAISLVLERHGMAVVAEDRHGKMQLLGPLAENAKRAFAAVIENGPALVNEVAQRLDMPPETTREVLNELLERRLVQQEAGGYRALIA